MTIRIIGRVCECTEGCGWVGSYAEVRSMAGFEFCPSCHHRYTGFMPKIISESKDLNSLPSIWMMPEDEPPQ